MVIRNFTDSDITGIYKLLSNELGKDISLSELKTTVSNMCNSKDYQIFVADIDGETVGFIGVCFGLAFEISGKVMRVIALSVKENVQNQGIGTRLVEAAEECARKNGADIIGVNSGLTREKAHAFYVNRGFNKKGYSFVKVLK